MKNDINKREKPHFEMLLRCTPWALQLMRRGGWAMHSFKCARAHTRVARPNHGNHIPRTRVSWCTRINNSSGRGHLGLVVGDLNRTGRGVWRARNKNLFSFIREHRQLQVTAVQSLILIICGGATRQPQLAGRKRSEVHFYQFEKVWPRKATLRSNWGIVFHLCSARVMACSNMNWWISISRPLLPFFPEFYHIFYSFME